METGWNPWHGCTKISPGCMHCYVYRMDANHGNAERACECRKTANFRLPVMKKRDGSYKIEPGTLIYTCFSSDFLIKDADEWRPEAWRMIREREDCDFFFYTKRIDRLSDVLPDDWGDGYDNVIIGCTVENQKMADYRLPIFLAAPVKHRCIGVEPMLEQIDLRKYLGEGIEEVALGGESGPEARLCDYAWVLDVREQCRESKTAFYFHQTGANFRKDGRIYRIPRKIQGSQARKAGIDYNP